MNFNAEIPEPTVRPATAAERKISEFEITSDRAATYRGQRIRQIINWARYEDAKMDHPAKAEHFDKLIAAGDDFMSAAAITLHEAGVDVIKVDQEAHDIVTEAWTAPIEVAA